jgi:hypothetical protein
LWTIGAGVLTLSVAWIRLLLQKHHLALSSSSSSTSSSSSQTVEFHSDAVEIVKREFYNRYGGRQVAERMLERGIQPFGSMNHTSQRILQAAANDQPFVLSFAGYSVTVGRGNHLFESYPFVLERILKPLLKDIFQVDVIVRNAAIGGIPSFPYGFCFQHFLGADADVVSWDYSMNEGKGAAVLEAYLRQSQVQLPHHPMMIVLDTNKFRCHLLDQYAQAGLIQDGMCVGMAKDVVEDKHLFTLPDDQKPPGFRNWDEFGAPDNCPGRGSWHPKKREHELIGWMMAMYFVQAIANAQSIAQQNPQWKTTYRRTETTTTTPLVFPKPMEEPPLNPPPVTDLLFGHADDNGNNYRLKQLSCRTSFLPATDADKVLPSIVVSGLAPDVTSDNIMKERSNEMYASGWVLDVSDIERDTKVKVENCGGLGYIDMKIALYGIPESGPLRLWLPMEHPGPHDKHSNDDQTTNAKHWFDEIIICEANEKRGKAACKLDQDIEYIVGGVKVETTNMIIGAGEYLKRKTCAHVGVPVASKVTRFKDLTSHDGTPLTAETRRRLIGSSDYDDNQVGLVLDVFAKPNVSRKNGACCLSHVVWEQH